MKPSLSLPFVLALLAVPMVAQSSSALKKELRVMEKAAKKDPDALLKAGAWAKENLLDKDAKRIFKKILKYDREHPGANLAIGNELVEGKWMPAKAAKKIRDKALAAKYASQGFKKIDGIWVAPDKVADAREGIFHHDGQKVSRDQKIGLQSGKVFHPVTGQMIDRQDLEKAEKGYFPINNGKWADKAEAEKYHSELSHPWIIRDDNATIISTLPIDKIDTLRASVDQGREKVAPLFGNVELSPSMRPVVIIAKTQAEYTQYGTALGDGTDVAGAFLISDEAEFRVKGLGVVRPAVCENHKDWGIRNIRHASAIAYVNGIAEDAGADLPLWLVHGSGSLTSRFENDSDAGWFGKQHVAKGGVSNIKSFLSGFSLSSDNDSPQIAFNLFQAGLLLSFATRGGNDDVTTAMLAVTDALSGKGRTSASKAITNLEKLLAESQDDIVAHLKMLITKAPR